MFVREPWMISGAKELHFHPKLEYVVVNIESLGRYVVSKKRVAELKSRLSLKVEIYDTFDITRF